MPQADRYSWATSLPGQLPVFSTRARTPQAEIALFHRGGPQGEGGVREAEAKGIQGLYPKGIEIAVAQVDALPVHGDSRLSKGLGRGRGLQAVVAVGEDVLRWSLSQEKSFQAG